MVTVRGGAAVARRAHNPKVTGSIPVPATIYFIIRFRAALIGGALWRLFYKFLLYTRLVSKSDSLLLDCFMLLCTKRPCYLNPDLFSSD